MRGSAASGATICSARAVNWPVCEYRTTSTFFIGQRALHAFEQMGVHAADGELVGMTAQRQRQLARLVAQCGGDGVAAHDRAAVDLPEAIRIELRLQLAQRGADQVLTIDAPRLFRARISYRY